MVGIKQRDLTIIYVNLVIGAIVTEPVPQSTRGKTFNWVCVFIAGKWEPGGSWSPRAPNQPPLLPRAWTAAAANTLPLWPSALLTSTWSLGDPYRVISQLLSKKPSPVKTKKHISPLAASLGVPSCQACGASHASSDASDIPRPHPALPCMALPQLWPCPCCRPTKKLYDTLLSSEEVELCGLNSLPSTTIARKTDRQIAQESSSQGSGRRQAMLLSVTMGSATRVISE